MFCLSCLLEQHRCIKAELHDDLIRLIRVALAKYVHVDSILYQVIRVIGNYVYDMAQHALLVLQSRIVDDCIALLHSPTCSLSLRVALLNALFNVLSQEGLEEQAPEQDRAKLHSKTEEIALSCLSDLIAELKEKASPSLESFLTFVLERDAIKEEFVRLGGMSLVCEWMQDSRDTLAMDIVHQLEEKLGSWPVTPEELDRVLRWASGQGATIEAQQLFSQQCLTFLALNDEFIARYFGALLEFCRTMLHLSMSALESRTWLLFLIGNLSRTDGHCQFVLDAKLHVRVLEFMTEQAPRLKEALAMEQSEPAVEFTFALLGCLKNLAVQGKPWSCVI